MFPSSLAIDPFTGDIYVGGIGMGDAPDSLYSPQSRDLPFVGRFSKFGKMYWMNFFITYQTNYYSSLYRVQLYQEENQTFVVASGSDAYYSYLKTFDSEGNTIYSNLLSLSQGSGQGLAVGFPSNNILQTNVVQALPYSNAVFQAFTSNYTLLWKFTNPNDLSSVVVSNNQIYVTGKANEDLNGNLIPTTQSDIIVYIINVAGQRKRIGFFGGDGSDSPNDILVHPTTGYVYICGTTTSSFILNSPGHGSNDAFIAKLDPDLNVIWVKLFGWALTDSALSMSLHSNGRIYIAAQLNNSIYSVFSFDPGNDPVLPLTPLPTSTAAYQTENVVYQTKNVVYNTLVSTSTINQIVTNSVKGQDKVLTEQNSIFALNNISPFALMAIGASILAFILIFLYIGKRILFRKEMGKKQETEFSEMTFNQTTTIAQTIGSTPLNGTNYDQTTAVGTVHELSIPVYLQLDYSKDFKVGNCIAKGGMGEISHCEPLKPELIDRSEKQNLVVKSIQNKSIEQMTEKVRKAFFQELSIMWRFRDLPMFVKVYGYTTTPKATMILKFYVLGSLEDFIQNKGRAALKYSFSKKAILHTLRWFCGSIQYMHQSGFVHLDIKPANVLLEQMANGYFIPVLTDFGIAQVVDKEQAQVVSKFETAELRGASLCYASPEVLSQLRNRFVPATKESRDLVFRKDVYSIGCMLYHLLNRQTPWFYME